MAQRLLACTGCHGKDGRAASDGYYPRIAGKPAGYLFRQLRAFRDGQRPYALMSSLLAPLDDAYLREIADHFAALELPYAAPPPPRADAATLRQGQTLALQGDAARDIPACQACHGAALTGVGADVPGLLGLPVDYLNAQLGAWRTGARRAAGARLHGADRAAARSPQDVNALAPLAGGAAGAGAARPPKRRRRRRRCAAAAWTGAAMKRLLAGLAALLLALAAALWWLNVRGDGDVWTARRSAATSPAAGRTRRLPGARRQLPGLPHAARRARRTPAGAASPRPSARSTARNLTPDAATGIGAWTPADFRRALHNGRSRDGRLLYPAFPYDSYTRISAEDADALFAFLRSLPAVAAAEPAACAALSLRHAGWRWRCGARCTSGPARFEPTGRAIGRVEPRRLPGAGPGPLQRLPCRPQCAGRDARPGGAGRRADPAAELVCAGLAGPKPAQAAGDRCCSAACPTTRALLGPMAEVVLHSTQHLSDGRPVGDGGCTCKSLPPADAPRARGRQRRRRRSCSAAPSSTSTHCAPCHGDAGPGRARRLCAAGRQPRRACATRRRTWCRWCWAAPSRRPPPATRGPSACRPLPPNWATRTWPRC